MDYPMCLTGLVGVKLLYTESLLSQQFVVCNFLSRELAITDKMKSIYLQL